FSVFAEYKYGDRLVATTVAAEFFGDDRGVSFSLTQRHKLFTDVIRQRGAMVPCLEQIAGHRKPFLPQNRLWRERSQPDAQPKPICADFPTKQPFKIEQSIRVHVGSASDRTQAYSRRFIHFV